MLHYNFCQKNSQSFFVVSSSVSKVEDMEGHQWDEIEKQKVAAMRLIVEAKDPRSKEVDDLVLRRFLRARDLDIEKASTFFLKHINWRWIFATKGSISESEIKNELSQTKAFIQGVDRKGRPIGLLLANRHIASKRDVNEFKRFAVYFLDKLCSRMEGGQEKFVMIADLQGWGYPNCDIRAYFGALDILQNNYPERLGVLFLVHVPYIFMKAWKMICPFIDNNSKEKFIFLEDKNMKEKLLEIIDESQLPQKYGGKLELVPVEDS